MESESEATSEQEVAAPVELPDTNKLKCPECLEPYNKNDKRRVQEDLCGHVKCRICCIEAEMCVTCFKHCPECGSAYNSSKLRRVKDTCDHFKCRGCFSKSENCQRCLVVEKLKTEKEVLLSSQSRLVQPYPTKVSLPRRPLTPTWSGPNSKIVSEIESRLQSSRKTRSKTKAAKEGKNKPNVRCSVCGLMFDIIRNDKRGNLCKHLKCGRCKKIYISKDSCPLCKADAWSKHASEEKPLPKTLAAPKSTRKKQRRAKGTVRFEAATEIKEMGEDAVVANCNVCLQQFINIDGGDVNCHCKPIETDPISSTLTTGEQPSLNVRDEEVDNDEGPPAPISPLSSTRGRTRTPRVVRKRSSRGRSRPRKLTKIAKVNYSRQSPG